MYMNPQRGNHAGSMSLNMEIGQKLNMEMRIAPHIIQSIEILTMPILELQTFIQQALENNPVLETVDTLESEEDSNLNREEDSFEENNDESNKEATLDEEQLNSFENLEYGDWEEFYNQDRIVKKGDDKDKKMEAMQNSADRPISLQDNLFQQFRLSDVPENLRPIGEQIIFNIDANGYLRYSLEEVIYTITPTPSLELAQEALRYVQRLEPAGIGARNIQECLILQLKEGEPDYSLKKELIEKYLEDIYHNRYPKIAKEIGRNIDDIKLAVEEIKRLNPKPGSEYSTEQSHIIMPDVVVEMIDGEYIIRMEEEYLPQLHINPYYINLLQIGKEEARTKDLKKKEENKGKDLKRKEDLENKNLSEDIIAKEDAKAKEDAEAKDFIKKKIDSAKLIIEAIQQRQNTLYRVVSELVKNQKLFLDHGINYLKPLKMQEVANALGIHVSTVSRAIAEKYIQTPRGIFPIKFFFTGSIDKKDGENESRVSVKQRVHEIIQQENKNNPLSDEEIVEKLKKSGLEIARRTVTKYRKALGIASSRRRKQY